MILVYQRVLQAGVLIDGRERRHISRGSVWLWGIHRGDQARDIAPLFQKALKLRCFPKSEGTDRMDLSLIDIGGSVLLVSQFTLCANLEKGNRPDFLGAEEPDKAKDLYVQGVEFLKAQPGIRVEVGEFGAHMEVSILNHGPVTFILKSGGADGK